MKTAKPERTRLKHQAILTASPLALAATLLFIEHGEANAAGCLVNGNPATEAVTVTCNTSNDPSDTPVSTGDFNDTVNVEDNVAVKTIRTLDGDDSVTIGGGATVGQSNAGNANAINMGDGNDTLIMTGNAKTYGIVVMGDGDNTVHLGGNAVIGVNRTRAFHTSLDMGDGNNSVIVTEDAHLSGLLQLGSGNDTVTVESGEVDYIRDDGGVDHFTINGGSVGRIGHAYDNQRASGGDTLVMNGGTLGVYSGSGDRDSVSLYGGTAQTINGGGGNDIITLDGTEVTGFLRGGWDLGSEDDADEIYLLSGSVGRSVLGEKGADHIVIDGATIGEGVTGDSAVLFQGNPIDDTVSDDLIEWKSGSIGTEDAPGYVAGGGGSDTIIISASEYDGTQEITGASYDWINGMPVHQDDGPQQDELTLQGLTVSTDAGLVTHWEKITLQDSDFTVSGSSWSVSRTDGNGIFLNRSSLHFDPDATIASNLTATENSTVDLASGTTLDGDLSSVNSAVTFGDGASLTGNARVSGGTFTAGNGFFVGGDSSFTDKSRVTLGDRTAFAGNIQISDSTVNFANQSSVSGNLRNDGTLSMQDGAAGDLLTVSGTYSGNGTLLMDIDPDTGSADNLTVGHVGSGSSYIQVSPVYTDVLPGPDSKWQLVTVTDGSGTPDSFLLEGGDAELGAYLYNLDFENGTFVLQNTGRFAPAASLYEVYPQVLLSLSRMSSLNTRVGNRYWNDDSASPATVTAYSESPEDDEAPFPVTDTGVPVIGQSSVWGRIGGARSHVDPTASSTGTTYDLDRFELDAGVDGLLADTADGRLIGGITAHYVHGATDTSSPSGDGSIDTNGYGFGGTLTWYGLNGFYADGQAELTWYDSDLETKRDGVFESGASAFGYGLSIEAGQRIALQDKLTLTPQAQLQYSAIDFDDFTDSLGSQISLRSGDQLLGRIGLMLDRESVWTDAMGETRRSSGYGIINVYHDFSDDTEVRVSQANLTSELDDWTGEIGFGGTYQWDDSKYVVYGEISLASGLESFGDSYAFGGNIGLSVRW
ncbi:autotransporter outer membrane beta-barrel domain-containing protein [uncultured Martelella sp.]|uniref:autotransporter family protein n=1 Tax=uncultured Martelella sp. TaxID=392331 RepID=UPI0029C8E2C0|nr:autotransporter outer membrane beta-barrel domain-containing protein [uncultured Martelella sp.]